MSNVTSALLECEDIQVELDNYFLTCSHTAHRPSPFLQFIYSDSNRSGLEFQVAPGGNKVKTIVARYDQKVPVSSVTTVTSDSLDCTAGSPVGDLSATYTIDPGVYLQAKESYDILDLTRICRTNETFIMSRINAMVEAVEAKIATQTAVEAKALVGNWASDVANVTGDALQVKTVLNGTVTPDPRFVSQINMAQMKTGYCSATGIFGSSTLYEATDNLKAGCCAATGYDLQAFLDAYGKVTAWDPYVEAAFNSQLIALSTQVGAMQLLTYTMGMEGNWPMIGGAGKSNYEIIDITSPRYGIPMDLVVTNNCGLLTIQVRVSTKLVAAPVDMFPVGDKQEGVNFVNIIQVANA